MNNEVLIAIFSKLIDEKLSELPRASVGPRGYRGSSGSDGKDGKDFVFSEHEETIKSWLKDFSLKFEDLTTEQVNSLKGRDGRGFLFSEHQEEIEGIVREFVGEISDSLKLKFSDLTEEELAGLRGARGRPGRDGKDGKDFVFEDHLDFFKSLKPKFSDLSEEEKLSLTLKFSHLTEAERGSLKLKFSDLSQDELLEIRGPRGQRGKPGRDGLNGKDGLSIRGLPGVTGPRGLQGPPGVYGADGRDGQDAPYVIGIDVSQKRDSFSLVFEFSDGSSLESPSIDLPGNIKETYIVGGALGGGGGSGGTGADGKSAYEIAVENGFVGTEADWLASLVGPPGADGADGADGIDGTSTEYFDEGVSLGQALELDFVGPGVSATKVGDRITVSVSAGPGNDVLYSVPCETDVYVGALVKLDALSPVDIFIDDWMTLLNVVTMSSNTYSVIASNALADSMQNSNVIGVVQAKPTASTCDIRIYGETPDLFLGLELSKEYYLSDTYPGSMVVYESRPFESGSVVLKVGQAASGQSFIFDRGERGFTSGTPTVNAPGYPDYSEKLEAFLNILAAHDIIASVDYLDDGIRTMRIGQVVYQSNLYPESEITKSISYADVGLMNQRITQIDFTGGAFGSATLSKIFEYVPSGIKQKLDGFYYELN